MADKKDLLLGELAVKLGFVTPARLDECLRILETASPPRPLGQIFLEKRLITQPQLQHLMQMQAKSSAALDPAAKRRRDAEVFGRFAIQKGMIDEGQFATAMRIFESSSDPDKTMAQVMIEIGMLSEAQVTEISMNQRQITMRCANCKLKFTIVTITERKEIPCPKCGKLLEKSTMETQKTPVSESQRLKMPPAAPPPQLMTQVFRAVKPVSQPKPAGPKKKSKAKCVVCDTSFEGELDADNRVTCPNCSTSFTIL
jgi:DNA-directed RNA polymerase subunit RPC12/RpoP